MPYIDGFVIAIPKNNVERYRALVQKTAELWLEHGALEYVESVLEDDGVPDGIVSFSALAGAKADETVIFAYVMHASREARDISNEKIMSDPRLEALSDNDNPFFDSSRMCFGGFDTLVARSR